MADGSIVIDTRINNKDAYAELKALQTKAKSTSQQINTLDKQIAQVSGKHVSLGDDLRRARQEAAATAREYRRLTSVLDENNARGIANDPADIKRVDMLYAQLEKQFQKVEQMSAEYRRQNADIGKLQKQHNALTAQLEEEQMAANAAADALARQKPVSERTDRAAKSLNHFSVRLKNIVLGALVFNLVSAALRTMVGGLGNAIAKTDGVSSALARLKGAASTAAAGLASALAPAITWLLNLLTSLINGFTKLISILTGKSVSGMKQAAKSLTSIGGAAGSAAKQVDKASGSLASFDELDTLGKKPEDDNLGAGGSGGAGTDIDFGFEKSNSALSGFADGMRAFWEAFKAQLSPSVEAWSAAWEQIKAAADAALPILQRSLSNLWKNGLQPLGEYFVLDFVPGVLNGINLILAPIAGDVISSAITILASVISSFADIATDSINAWIIPALDLLKVAWLDIATAFNEAWTTYISPVFGWFAEMVQDVCDWVQRLCTEYIDPALDAIVEDLRWLWEDHLQPLFSDLITVGGDAINLIAGIIKGVWDSIIAPLANWLLDIFGPLFLDVFKGAAEAVNLAFALIADAIDLGLIALKGVIDFLREVFEGDWEEAWNVVKDTAFKIWDSISGKIKGTINDIIGFVNRMISAIVNGLNAVIRSLNRLNFTVPSWVPGLGGVSFGFNISEIPAYQIPYLAQGAVIPPNREFMAVLGDQTSGTNIEAPLDTIKQALAEVMAEMSPQQTEIVIKFAASGGLEQLVRLLKPYIDKENNRCGTKLITGGAY